MQKTLAVDLTVEQNAHLRDGLRLLHEGAFFTAHECFEEMFRQTDGQVRTLFRALTQLSASYYQLTLGRGRAARSTMRKACRNLELLGLLSELFQQRVDVLLVQRGAGPECARFIAVAADDLTNWPIPDGLPRGP